MQNDLQKEQEVRRLMQAGMGDDDKLMLSRKAVVRVRQRVGERDTLAFALVRIWAALARLLSPFFARFGEAQARALHNRDLGRRVARKSTTNSTDKSDKSR